MKYPVTLKKSHTINKQLATKKINVMHKHPCDTVNVIVTNVNVILPYMHLVINVNNPNKQCAKIIRS